MRWGSLSPPKPGCCGVTTVLCSALLLSSAGSAPCTACCTQTRRGAPPTWFTRRCRCPSSLVPSFPGIRRACGTCVRVCVVRPGGRTDGRRCCGIAQCVCVLKAAVRPLEPLPCLPGCPCPLPGRWGGAGTEHLTTGLPAAAGPHAMRGERPQRGALPHPGLASPYFFFFFLKC